MVGPDVPNVLLADALNLVQIGDVGIMGPTSFFGRWIVRVGRHWASHCWVFFRSKRRGLWICEQIFPKGRITPARTYLRLCPSGLVVVYRPRWPNRYHRDKAVKWMLQNVPGTPYDSRGIARSALTYLPGFRESVRPDNDDEANGDNKRPLYCSGMVSRMLRHGNLDPAHGLADNWTEPSDIAKSAVLDPLFRIVKEVQT